MDYSEIHIYRGNKMETIERRRSIRKYKDTPVEKDLLLKLIRSAAMVP